MAPCVCCGLPKAHFRVSPQSAAGLPGTPPAVCGVCSRHQGQLEYDLRKQVKDHIELWREYALSVADEAEDKCATQVAKLDETIAGLEGSIAALGQELEDRPVQVVNKYIGQSVIDQADADKERAYRSRDKAFRDMTRLHLMHFEHTAGRCRCGKSIEACEEAEILETNRALKGWEKVQAERRRRGEHHQLPEGHPGIVDARWDPDDESVIEFDDDR